MISDNQAAQKRGNRIAIVIGLILMAAIIIATLFM
jgi:hypothetical protein